MTWWILPSFVESVLAKRCDTAGTKDFAWKAGRWSAAARSDLLMPL